MMGTLQGRARRCGLGPQCAGGGTQLAVLADRDRQAITALFADAVRPVEVAVVLPGVPNPADRQGFRAAIQEVTEMIPLVTVRELGSAEAAGLVERVPGVALLRPDGTDLRVRFAGLPTGYEFSSFLSAVADAAAPETRLQPATAEALAELAADVHIKVFSTPT